MSQEVSSPKPVGTWRKVLAAIFDFFTILFVAGYGVAYFTGNTTEGGFQLNGGPAFLAFAIMIAYFVIFSKFLGGTLWQRIFGVR
jgi:hypothetical protein